MQVNPVDGDTDDVRLTVPANPFIDAIEIVELPEVPAVAKTLVGLDDTEKSGTATL